MFYIVQKNVFKEHNYMKIFETLDRLELEYEIVDCPPFIEDLEIVTDRKDVFPFGSVKMARLSKKLDWTPGSFFGGNHDYMKYSRYYRENLLNYDSIILQFSDKLHWNLNEVKFIRPTQDSKLFHGGLYTKVKWEDLVERTLKNWPEQDTSLIQIGSPKAIYKEARVWVVDGKIVTSSYYFFNGKIDWQENVEPEGLEFAQKMIDIYQPAECFVLDICDTPDSWKIVEVNCINCSGFYQGDLQKLIIALEDKYN